MGCPRPGVVLSSVSSVTASFVRRVFEQRSATDRKPVALELGVPECDPLDGAWRCRLRLRGASVAIDQHAYGEDGLQALLLAIEMARVLLTTTPWPPGTSLTWCEDAELGLPMPPPGAPAA